MRTALSIVQNTPWWVFVLLLLLIGLGVQALRPRVIPVRRLLIVPAVFIVWGVASLVARSIGSPLLLLDWLSACAMGLALGWRTARIDRLTIDRPRRVVQVPGSVFPLARNLAVFTAKYALGVALALTPAAAAALVPLDAAVSGLATGYFLGWVGRFAVKYRDLETLTAVARG